jgi:hypothetical protein
MSLAINSAQLPNTLVAVSAMVVVVMSVTIAAEVEAE